MTKIPLLLAAATLPVAAFATTVTKADSTGNLDLAASWNGGVAPTSTDVADFSGAYNTANSLSQSFTASTPVSWQGISVGSLSGTAAGLVSIGGTVAAATGSSVTIGSAGIDMSAANQNLVINSATTVLGASQTWNVATGRNLRFGVTGTGSANSNIDGGSGVIVTVQGGGLVDLNQGSGAAGLSGYAGKWVVASGTTLRGVRNNAEAFGSNTAADAITLQGGTLAVGGITGSQGNWSFNSNITLAAATSSIIDNQSFASGTDRYLKLMGVISGSGNLAFNNTSAAQMNNVNRGFLITATNTNTGTVTINSGAFVRVGANSAFDNTGQNTGNFGKLAADSASVVNNGTLTFARLDAHTVANAISGTGTVSIGLAVLHGTATTTQNVTLTGANTYTGATTVNNGTLITGNATALGNGSAAVTVTAGTLQIGNGTANSVTLGSGANLVIATGATLKFFAADSAIALQGAGSYTIGNSTLDLNSLFNAAGTYHLISGGNAAGGTQGTLTFSNFDNTNFSAAFSGGDLVVTAVPEPSTYGLMGAGALAAVAFVRRRRKLAGIAA